MSRIAALSGLLLCVTLAAGCDKVPLLAPTGSTVTLSVSSTNVPAAGSSELVASVIESAGTPVHDGTEVRFQASVGKVDPPVVQTQGGIARTTFFGNGASGTARITAFSGGASSDEVEVRVGSAAAETVTLRLTPASVPQTGGTVQVNAIVRDESGNPLPGATVVFTADNGSLSSSSAITDAAGEAVVTLQTNRETVVRASVAGQEAEATVRLVTLPSVSVQVSPSNPVVGAPVTFTFTPGTATTGDPLQSVIVDFGDGTRTTDLGAISSTQTVSHVYSREGTYTVSVTAVDSGGQRNTTSTVVTVQPAVVNVTVTATPTPAAVGSAVTITASAASQSSSTITSIRLDYGDGQSTTHAGNSASAQHVYGVPGTYLVRAFARDPAGNEYQGATQVVVTTGTITPSP